MTDALDGTRVGVFLPALYDGGAEKTMLALAGGFAARGLDVDLILAHAAGPYLSAVPESVRLVDLRCRRTVSSLPGLVGYLRRERPDAVVSALSRANVVALLSRRLAGHPRRLIVNEQNTLSQWAAGASSWRDKLTPLCARWTYGTADAVVAVSRGVAEDLVRACGIPSRLVQVIHNPGATPEVKRRAALAPDHPWFAPGEPPVLVAAGRLAPQKDFGMLLHAFASVRSRRVVRLLILGEGPERAALEALVDRLGLRDDVRLPGFVDNPYAFMSHAAAFVLSSRFEGLPTVLVEALTCGAPLVATDCPSGPSEILDGGKLGLLVPVGDSDALARAIEKTLDGQAPRAHADSSRPYELDAVVDRYLALLTGASGRVSATQLDGAGVQASVGEDSPRRR